MRISALSIPLLAAFFFPAVLRPAEMPSINSVDPSSGNIGDVLLVQGTNLDRNSVAALYLTDGIIDIKVPIVEQMATSIKFRIPPEAKPGRFALMVLTTGDHPKLIEEPVKVVVGPMPSATS